MLLGVVFMFCSVLFGAAVSKLLKVSFKCEERICFSILFGISTSTIIVYLFSYVQGSLNLTSIASAIALTILIVLVLIKWRKVFNHTLLGNGFNFENVAVMFAATAAFLVLNLRCVLREEYKSVCCSLFACGDYCFHVSIINSFVCRNNFPPQYPVMINAPMGYPILVDFLSAVLVKTGFDLRSSIIIPNVLFQASTLCLISSLAFRIFGKRYVGALSAFLFFSAGNMGIIYAFQDMLNSGNFARWIANLPTDYSGSGISDLPMIRFGNPVAVMLLPQRASALGIGTSILVYILVFYSLKNRENLGELVFSGILMGLLPIIHSHSFIAVAIAVFLLMLGFKKRLRFFAAIFIPAAVLALPQILAIQTQMKEGFMGLTIGWLEINTDRIASLDWNTPLNVLLSSVQSALVLAWFWLMNIGVIILPLIFGLRKSDKTNRSFYLPFLALFILGNFVRFQPWDWDNYKILLHWHIATVIFASYGIIMIAESVFKGFKCAAKHKKFSKKFLKPILKAAALAGILFFATATGFLSCVKMVQESYLMWTESDLIFAEWIRENTPQESIFLTGTHYSQPVVTLGGRQIILGYEGWLWSHGISLKHIQQVKSDVIKMFRGDYTLITEYRVNFISITPYERTFALENGFKIDLEYFGDKGHFEKVYDETLNGEEYIIFKVLN